MDNFVHLHNHSWYSLLDGLNSPQELLEAARDNGQTAMAVTDHGTLAAHRDFQKNATDMGIKPILGLEAYISPTDRFDRRPVKNREDNTSLYHHIILLAKNQNGLKNLMGMSQIAWETGYYFKPRIDKDLLTDMGKDIIVLSGCMSGLVAKAILNENFEEAERWMEYLTDSFGSDFFVEVQAHNPPELNAKLL